MKDLAIKPMVLNHLPEVRRIEREAFNSPWSIAAFVQELYNNKADYYVGLKEKQVLGYIGAWILSKELHITNLAVAVACQRKGVATNLLQFMYSRANQLNISKISLEVRVSNQPAQRLYLKEGFIKVKVKSNYYKDNSEDAIVMWKQL